MKRIACLVIAGIFSAMAASAATVPGSLKSKVASDKTLSEVRGGSATGFSVTSVVVPVAFKGVLLGFYVVGSGLNTTGFGTPVAVPASELMSKFWLVTADFKGKTIYFSPALGGLQLAQ